MDLDIDGPDDARWAELGAAGQAVIPHLSARAVLDDDSMSCASPAIVFGDRTGPGGSAADLAWFDDDTQVWRFDAPAVDVFETSDLGFDADPAAVAAWLDVTTRRVWDEHGEPAPVFG